MASDQDKYMADKAFWRFFLDLKQEPGLHQEPRFRTFADNMRNFVIAGGIMKAAAIIYRSGTAKENALSGWLLFVVGFAVAGLSVVQLIGFFLYIAEFCAVYGPRPSLLSLRGVSQAAGIFLAAALACILVAAMWMFAEVNGTSAK